MTTLVVASCILLAPSALAHGVGLSRGEYAVGAREVTSRLVVARHEAALLAGETASDAVVGLALAQRTRVSMGGRPCTVALDSVQKVEADGVELRLRHACPEPGDVTLSFDFVGALDPGHRHVAEIRAPGASVTPFVAFKGNSVTTVAGSRSGAAPASRPALAFLWMGVEHILTGWDHLLFLLGVSLLPWRLRSSRQEDRRAPLRTLILSVSAFTVAHSVTLTLGVLRVAPLVPAWVEPLIALSIAAVGLEALFSKHAAAPYVTTFGFGLIHGMGFAGALVELELAGHQLPVALALFNLGVEAGQLAALAPVVAALTLAARTPAVLARLVPATSVALTLAGVALFGARIHESLHQREGAASATAAPVPSAPAQPRATAPGPAASEATAARVCSAIQDVPRTRRAECEGRPAGLSLTSSCRSHLSRALGTGAVTFDGDALDACLADLGRRYETCDFVKQRSAARPASCSGVLVGTRPSGSPCRSSLECLEGLVCDGASALDPGVCRPPRAPGEACGMGTDTLAGHLHAIAGDGPAECAAGGACAQNRCQAPASAHAKR